MTKSFLFIVFLFLQGCKAPSNFLIGTWAFDGARTLSELRQREDVPIELLSCFERNVCGDGGIKLIYSENNWSNSFDDMSELIPDQISYEREVISSNVYRISTTSQGEPDVYTVHLVNELSIYIELDFNGFEYREYFKKTH